MSPNHGSRAMMWSCLQAPSQPRIVEGWLTTAITQRMVSRVAGQTEVSSNSHAQRIWFNCELYVAPVLSATEQPALRSIIPSSMPWTQPPLALNSESAASERRGVDLDDVRDEGKGKAKHSWIVPAPPRFGVAMRHCRKNGLSKGTV